MIFKGQLISEWFLGSSISSKKWANEFNFPTMRLVFVRFLEEFDDPKKPFRNWLTFSIFLFFYVLENFTIEGILLINWRIKSSLLLANHLLLIQWQYCSLKIGWYIFHPVLVDHFFVIFLESSGLCMVSVQERLVTVHWKGHRNNPLLFDINNTKSKIRKFIQIVVAFSGF